MRVREQAPRSPPWRWPPTRPTAARRDGGEHLLARQAVARSGGGCVRLPPLIAAARVRSVGRIARSGRCGQRSARPGDLSLIHISEPTRLRRISYAVFCLKKKKKK